MWYLIFCTMATAVSFTGHYGNDSSCYRRPSALSRAALSSSFQMQWVSTPTVHLVKWSFVSSISVGSKTTCLAIKTHPLASFLLEYLLARMIFYLFTAFMVRRSFPLMFNCQGVNVRSWKQLIFQFPIFHRWTALVNLGHQCWRSTTLFPGDHW